MISQSANTLLGLWQANTLRLTAFVPPGSGLRTQNWWMDLLGEPPDNESSQPKVQKLTQEGLFDQGKLHFELQPGRIDWKYVAIEKEKENSTASSAEVLPTIGPFQETLETFLQLMMRWFSFESCPTATRLAFGAILFLPVASRESGYRQLSTYLPFLDLDPQYVSDLVYQINRRRPSVSGPQGLYVNRLSKWSVGGFQNQALVLGPEGVQLVTSGSVYHACSLELDINTAQEFTGVLERNIL
ncbi:MAG: hypothetical protein AB1791_17900, partial [Chloroflexota bacterium]